MKLHKPTIKKLLDILLCMIIFAYAFRNVTYRLDITDGGYHFSNFLYVEQMDPMWFFSTYLSNILGHFFTLLPFGKTLLGINVYTSIIPAMLGVICYLFFVNKLKTPRIIAFLGEIIALSLCWCPTTGLYNYLTYLFLTIGCILIYIGLTKGKDKYLFLAGIVLGINVFVRFSNLVEIALILVVWAHLWLKKESFRQTFKKTLCCLGGYACGLALILVPIMFLYGLDSYVIGISKLFSMTKVATAYSPLSMILNMCHAYLDNLKWFANIVYFCILGMILFAVAPEKYHKLKIGFFSLATVVFVRKLYGMSMFTLQFDNYSSIYEWSIVVIFSVAVLAFWQFMSDKFTIEEKTISVIILVIVLINPLGTNNQFYTYINNMFFVAPYIGGVSLRILKGKKFSNLYLEDKKYVLSTYPLCIMLIVGAVVYTMLSLGFGKYFAYHNPLENGLRNAKVENIDALKGMYTNQSTAEQLDELAAYINEQNFDDKNAIFFRAPALPAYLEIPYLMTPWPDLESFSGEDFLAGVRKIEDNIENDRPLIIVSREFYDYLCEENIDLARYYQIKEMYGTKGGVLKEFVRRYQYTCTFHNNNFAVLE